MIRIGPPPPMLPRLRPRWVAIQEHLSRQGNFLQESGQHGIVLIKTWWMQSSPWAVVLRRFRERAICRRQALFSEFADKYDDLVDLLCWAAQDGVHTNRDTRYAELRRWMCRNYRVLRPALRHHLRQAEPDSSDDPFEALFVPDNVEQVLYGDNSIENMMRSRSALESYRSELTP